MLGQKYKNILVGFLVQRKSLEFAFEINWPLEGFKYDMNHTLDANENDQIAAAIAASLKETTVQITSKG